MALFVFRLLTCSSPARHFPVTSTLLIRYSTVTKGTLVGVARTCRITTFPGPALTENSQLSASNRQPSQRFRIAYTTITLLPATPSAFLDLLPRFGIFPGFRSSLRAFSDSAPASLAERSTRLSQQLLEVGPLNDLFLVVESRSPRVQPDERVAVQVWRFLDSDKRYAVVSFIPLL